MKQTLRNNYQHTVYACFVGYVVQAVVNNFAPLLFVMLSRQYHISVEQISILISVNFGIQLLVDFLSSGFVDRIGYKKSVVLAHFLAAVGLIAFALLPGIFSQPFMGLLAAVAVYAVGGGLLEVLISPIVEACPTERKEAVMSLLHSFYCWGHAGVILLSTLFFVTAGIEHWKLLAVLWALIPILNMIYFLLVPVPSLKGEEGLRGIGKLMKNPTFWLMIVFMLCAGASEQGVSQWASAFAEEGLGVSKTVGDLAGPLTFALLMGSSRLFYAKYSEKIKLEKYMIFSTLLCISSYLLIALTDRSLFGLLGCAICGFSVGVMWPGTFSIAAKTIRTGGTAMFAFLALAGDLGCAGGPGVVGWIAERANGNLKTGMLVAVLFPIVLLIGLIFAGRQRNQQKI